MESVVTSLLAITHCEAGFQKVAREPLNVAKTVDESWPPFAAQAEQKKLSVTLQIPIGSMVQTDRVLPGFILTNLYSNAIAYSPIGMAVLIRFTDNSWLTALSVKNTVDNLSTEDLPRLFERFWRKDPARSPSDHSGLGLALAAACAEALNMKTAAQRSKNRQLTISIATI